MYAEPTTRDDHFCCGDTFVNYQEGNLADYLYKLQYKKMTNLQFFQKLLKSWIYFFGEGEGSISII